MRKIRIISPFISLFLITLILSGSFGFTLIHHTCIHCGTNETIASLAGDPVGDNCCGNHGNSCCGDQKATSCSHGDCDVQHRHSTGDAVLSDDCCTHETERVVTDELVRTEAQNEILPYFLAATIIAVMEEHQTNNYNHFSGEQPFHCGRDLTTMLCRIRS
ncbi:MAG: hypothetical protein KBB24_08175 [Bacteroidales bacterium]|nr:hypothetical protein [Bacteroidales bacterium]MDX9927779.1 hypothetical protein [Bacteroidales bacterium]HNX84704.1 hypothetical protein [Bacteroidales bacterium]HPS98451.1 hypothetical protein [Bacteroidales bacterium]